MDIIKSEIYIYSIKLLSKQDYSIFKFQNKLRTKKFSLEEIETVTDKLIALRYLNEAQYTSAKIKQLIKKAYSNNYIQLKLDSEFLNATENDVNGLREEVGISEESQIKDLLDLKMRGISIPVSFEAKMKLKSQISNYIARKGYPYDDIQDLMSNLF